MRSNTSHGTHVPPCARQLLDELDLGHTQDSNMQRFNIKTRHNVCVCCGEEQEYYRSIVFDLQKNVTPPTWVRPRLEHHGCRPLHRLRRELEGGRPWQTHPDAAVREGLDQDEDVGRPAPAHPGHRYSPRRRLSDPPIDGRDFRRLQSDRRRRRRRVIVFSGDRTGQQNGEGGSCVC